MWGKSRDALQKGASLFIHLSTEVRGNKPFGSELLCFLPAPFPGGVQEKRFITAQTRIFYARINLAKEKTFARLIFNLAFSFVESLYLHCTRFFPKVQ
jgi:hypothetical protein